MKHFFLLLFVIAGAATSSALAATSSSGQPIHLTNGAIATPYAHCGDLDLCARIAYDSGNVLSIYSEGAAECQPYFLHFVYADNTGKTLFEFSRALNHTNTRDAGCGRTVSTEMVLDRGHVHMLAAENSDGTLDISFNVAKQ